MARTVRGLLKVRNCFRKNKNKLWIPSEAKRNSSSKLENLGSPLILTLVIASLLFLFVLLHFLRHTFCSPQSAWPQSHLGELTEHTSTQCLPVSVCMSRQQESLFAKCKEHSMGDHDALQKMLKVSLTGALWSRDTAGDKPQHSISRSVTATSVSRPSRTEMHLCVCSFLSVSGHRKCECDDVMAGVC